MAFIPTSSTANYKLVDTKPTGYWHVHFNLDWDSADNWVGMGIKVKAEDVDSAITAAMPHFQAKFNQVFLDTVEFQVVPEMT